MACLSQDRPKSLLFFLLMTCCFAPKADAQQQARQDFFCHCITQNIQNRSFNLKGLEFTLDSCTLITLKKFTTETALIDLDSDLRVLYEQTKIDVLYRYPELAVLMPESTNSKELVDLGVIIELGPPPDLDSLSPPPSPPPSPPMLTPPPSPRNMGYGRPIVLVISSTETSALLTVSVRIWDEKKAVDMFKKYPISYKGKPVGFANSQPFTVQFGKDRAVKQEVFRGDECEPPCDAMTEMIQYTPEIDEIGIKHETGMYACKFNLPQWTERRKK